MKFTIFRNLHLFFTCGVNEFRISNFFKPAESCSKIIFPKLINFPSLFFSHWFYFAQNRSNPRGCGGATRLNLTCPLNRSACRTLWYVNVHVGNYGNASSLMGIWIFNYGVIMSQSLSHRLALYGTVSLLV